MDSETFNMMPEVTFGATSNTTANEKAKEFLQGRERPKTKEDAIKAYNDIDMFPRTRRSVPGADRTDGKTVDMFLEPIARTENPSISSWSRSHGRASPSISSRPRSHGRT